MTDRRLSPLLPTAVAVCGFVAVAVGVSAGAVPQPGFDRPVWYGVVALVVGYWLSVVTLARARRRDESERE